MSDTIKLSGGYVSDADGILRCGQCVYEDMIGITFTRPVGVRTTLDDLPYAPVVPYNPQAGDDFCSDCDAPINNVHIGI